MAEITVDMLGKPSGGIFNLAGLKYNLDFQQGSKTLEVGDFDCRLDTLESIQEWINDGKGMEGLPLDIYVDGHRLSRGAIYPRDIYCDKAICEYREKNSFEWINNTAKSFTFETLWEEGKISQFDLVKVPYVISSLPQGRDAFILSLSTFVIISELNDQRQSLIDYIASLGGVLTFGNALSIATRVIYIGLLILTIVKMIKDILDLLIQRVKYWSAMKLEKLLEVGAKEMGLKFSSSLIEGKWKNAVIIPEKFALPDDGKGVLGFLSKNKISDGGYFRGTYFDLLSLMRTMFNCDFSVQDGFLLMEQNFDSVGEIPELEPIETPFYRFNKEDFVSNHILSFQVDQNDKNTVQNFKGTSVQYQTKITNVSEIANLDAGGLEELVISLARGTRKQKLTIVEELFSELAKVVDFIGAALVKAVNSAISVINKITKFINKLIKKLNKVPGINFNFNFKPIKKIVYNKLNEAIENRIGMLSTETDFNAVPKLVFIGSDGKLLKEQITAKEVFEGYHTSKLFDPKYNNNAQRHVYSIDSVLLCQKDLLEVEKTRKVVDPVNKKNSEVTTIGWDMHTEHCSIEYKVPKIWLPNLTTLIIEPDGS